MQMKDNSMPRGVKVERPVSTEPEEVFIYVLIRVNILSKSPKFVGH